MAQRVLLEDLGRVPHNSELEGPNGEPGRHDEGPVGGMYARRAPDGKVEVVNAEGKPFGTPIVPDDEKLELMNADLANANSEIAELRAQLEAERKARRGAEAAAQSARDAAERAMIDQRNAAAAAAKPALAPPAPPAPPAATEPTEKK